MSADDFVKLSRRALLLLELVGRLSGGFGGARRAVIEAGRLLSQAAQMMLLTGLTRVQRLQDQFVGAGVLIVGSSGSDLMRPRPDLVSSSILGFLRKGGGGGGDVG